MRFRISIHQLLLILTALALLFAYIRFRGPGFAITVHNIDTISLEDVAIFINNKRFEIGRLKPAKSKTLTVRPKSVSDIGLEFAFGSPQRMEVRVYSETLLWPGRHYGKVDIYVDRNGRKREESRFHPKQTMNSDGPPPAEDAPRP